jgi:hypothetical protein
MRIELPSGSWDPAALRVDDDAHTLTLAPNPQDRLVAGDSAQPAQALRVEVAPSAPQVLTLTL